MRIRTTDLDGLALDWAAAISSGKQLSPWHPEFLRTLKRDFNYSGDFSLAWPIIQDPDFMFGPSPFSGGEYAAGYGSDWDTARFISEGPTRLVATMRAFVRKALGDEVDVPDELVGMGSKPKVRPR